MEKSNYLHYEISNFAKEGYLAKHNSSYWKGSDYLGIGPSAHSYNGIERQWNIANNQLYIKYINENKPFFEKEVLTPAQKYNEYILTRLRTQFGCSINEIESLFGMELKKHFLKVTSNHTEYFNICNDRYILNSKRGYLIADKITAELFI